VLWHYGGREGYRLGADTIQDRLFRIFHKLGVSGRVELLFMVLMNRELVGVEMLVEEIAELKRLRDKPERALFFVIKRPSLP
jgi:hypothetical protein